jgi:hypothetical protein
VDAFATDRCPTDSTHAALVLELLDVLYECIPRLDITPQVVSEGSSKIAQGALKWAKQQVHVTACYCNPISASPARDVL